MQLVKEKAAGQLTARLTPPKDRAVFGVAVSFFVMVFVANTLCSQCPSSLHCITLRCAITANQHTEQKPTPKKLPEATLT
jgi:hypothetical protein